MSIHVEFVSPERIIFTAEAKEIIVRTSDGEIGFMPGHVPFVVEIQRGSRPCTRLHGDAVQVEVKFLRCKGLLPRLHCRRWPGHAPHARD